MKKILAGAMIATLALILSQASPQPASAQVNSAQMSVQAQLELIQVLLAQVMELQRMLLAMQGNISLPVQPQIAQRAPMITSVTSDELDGVTYLRVRGQNLQNVTKAFLSTLVDGEAEIGVASRQLDLITIQLTDGSAAAYRNRHINRMSLRLTDNQGRSSGYFSLMSAAHSTKSNVLTLFSAKSTNPKTGATLLVWNARERSAVDIDVVCEPGTISFTTNYGNKPSCEKGGIMAWSNDRAGTIEVTPVGNTRPVTVTFVATVFRNGQNTGETLSETVTFPVPRLLSPEMHNVTFSNSQGNTHQAGNVHLNNPNSETQHFDFKFTLKNYYPGLVLDVEPYVKCDDQYLQGWTRNCAQYLFNLGQKAGESYRSVAGDPYVKGGALYRFTGLATPSGETIAISSYPNPNYYPGTNEASVTPDRIIYKFILRDINQGGKEIWSREYIVQFKG